MLSPTIPAAFIGVILSVSAMRNPICSKPVKVKIRHNYSPAERKAMAIILASVHENQLDDSEYPLSLQAFDKVNLQGTANRLDTMMALMPRLVVMTIEWYDPEREAWGTCAVLQGIEIRNQALFFSFNSYFIKLWSNPRALSRLHLLASVNLSRKHSLVIYEFLLDQLKAKNKSTQKLIVSIEKLREILELEADKYIQYKEFNRSVLLPAMKTEKGDINRFTDLDVSYTSHRTGRKVSHIEITIRRVDAFRPSRDLSSFSQAAPVPFVALLNRNVVNG